MINIKEKIKFHNRYDLQLIDAATGRVKQEAHAENVVLDKIWDIFMDPSSGRYGSSVLRRVQLGTGTGEPSSSDTGVFTLGAYIDISTSNTVKVSASEQYPTSSYVYRISIPATSSYVGDYTEIAIAGGVQTSNSFSLRYWSHAMFEDAEGNPITISKTDLDVLVITFTAYITLGASDDNFMWVHPSRNIFHALFRANIGGSATVPLSVYSTTANRLRLCHCIITDGQTITDWQGITVGATDSGYSNSVDERTFGTTTQRLGTNSGNNNYYHGIIFGMTTSSGTNVGIGGIVLPNTNVFPNRPIVGASVGAGDGETTDFDVPIPYFIDGTDAIYVDGVRLTRDVDYTLLSSSNVKKLDCVQPWRHMRMISNGSPGGSISRDAYIPFSAVSRTTTDPNMLFNTVGPMVFELLDNAPIDRFNDLKICLYRNGGDSGTWGRAHYKSTTDSSWVRAPRTIDLSGANLIVETSMDRNSWDTAATIDLGTPTANAYRDGWSGSNFFIYWYMYRVQLDASKQFKYMRFTLDCSNAESQELATAYAVALETTVDAERSDSTHGAYVNVIEQNDTEMPLHFVTPPAAGTAITMDATINRPFKTDQHVIDIAMTLQF